MNHFDDRLRQLRHDRAVRLDGDRFLHDRAFDDCLDRLGDMRRAFRSVLIAGLAVPDWAGQLRSALPDADVSVASGVELLALAPAAFDLCLSIGELEAVNDLQTATFTLRHLLRGGGLLIGAIVGGNSLPRLRTAMLAADRIGGGASPRIHPSIDGPSLSALLGSVGLVDPVVDVDRIDVAYPDLDRLVGDLRAMGCTNALAKRSRRPITRRERDAARAAFLGEEKGAIERFELLHFTAWAPDDGQSDQQINRAVGMFS